MKKRSKFVSFVIGLFRFVLICTLVLSIFASTISVFLNNTLLNKQFYKTQLTSDTYIDEIYEYTKKAVKTSLLYLGLPYDEIIKAVTRDSVKELSDEYCEAMYESLTSGKSMRSVSFSSDNIFKLLDEYFIKENYDITEDETKLIADNIAETISANIVVIKDSYGSVNLFRPLSKYIFANKIITAFAKYSVWIVILCAVLTVLSLLLSASSFKTRLYNVANAYWLAGCVMFIPVVFFKNHDIFSKLAISKSPLKSFVDIIGTPIIDKLFSITRVVFIISCIILAISMAVYIVSLILKHKNKSKESTDVAEDNDKIDPEINEEPNDNSNNDCSDKVEKSKELNSENIADTINSIFDDKSKTEE
ncbi:MAG: hypothetical protein ACI4II_02600 [Acutalibacteraceae bacterium]